MIITKRQFMLGVLAAALPIPAWAASQIYVLGKTKITIGVYQQGSGPIYFAPHDNENTCVAAARAVIAAHGGRLIELKHKGTRNVSFELGGQHYTVDPNRIFTVAGIKATLAKLGKYSGEAEREVAKFALAVLAALNIVGMRSGFVVALHNNSAGSYSVETYAPGGAQSGETDRIFVSPNKSPDDFFFVTELEIFNYLAKKGYNVVLQGIGRLTDDGSLSVFCGQRGIPYANVEAQEGHLHEQTEMIKILTER